MLCPAGQETGVKSSMWKWGAKSAGEHGAGSLLVVGWSRDSVADEAGEIGEAVACGALK